MAQHSLSLHADDRLRSGDLSLVEDLQAVDVGGKTKQFYSFATKYRSHHRPDCYPIYDSYVGAVLLYFRDRDRFSAFSAGDLKVYRRFHQVLPAFQRFYALEAYSLKQLDRYLWQLGKVYFPKQYQ